MLSLFWCKKRSDTGGLRPPPRDIWFVGLPTHADGKKLFPLFYRHYMFDYLDEEWDMLDLPAQYYEDKQAAEVEAAKRNDGVVRH